MDILFINIITLKNDLVGQIFCFNNYLHEIFIINI